MNKSIQFLTSHIFKKTGHIIALGFLLFASWATVEASTVQVVVFNERISRVEEGAVVSWNTNVPATSRVVYGGESVPTAGSSLQFEGYQGGTPRTHGPLVTTHAVTVFNTSADIRFFRPISKAGAQIGFGQELTLGGSVASNIPQAQNQVSVVGQVAVQTGCPYITSYLKYGAENDQENVRRLQEFLKTREGENVVVTGVFDADTFSAVKRFQLKHADEVLKPWGYSDATGYVYMLTTKKINELHCNTNIPLSDAQFEEIRAFISRGSDIGVVTEVVIPTQTVIVPVEEILPLATTTVDVPVTKPVIAPISTTTSFNINETVSDRPTVTPVANVLDATVRESAGDAVSLLFTLPQNSKDLVVSFLSFLSMIGLIYVGGNVVAHIGSEGLSRTLLRIKKLKLYAVGVCIAIPLSLILGFSYFVVPFAIILVALMVSLFFYRNKLRKELDSVIALTQKPL